MHEEVPGHRIQGQLHTRSWDSKDKGDDLRPLWATYRSDHDPCPLRKPFILGGKFSTEEFRRNTGRRKYSHSADAISRDLDHILGWLRENHGVMCSPIVILALRVFAFDSTGDDSPVVIDRTAAGVGNQGRVGSIPSKNLRSICHCVYMLC